MKTLKSLVAVTLLIAGSISFNQAKGQENQNNKTIKLYTNFGWTSTERTLGFNTTNLISRIEKNKETKIGYFTPSIAIVLPNGNFQEFELSRLEINNTNSETNLTNDSTGKTIQIVSGQKVTNILIAFRYEYNIMFLKKKEGAKIRPYLGFSANPYFYNSKYRPIVSNLFPTNQNNFGVTLSIIPRLIYNLNEKWFVDFNIPINLADVNWTFDKVDNPVLTEQERTTTTVEYSTLPNKFLFRLGVGLRI